MERCLTPVSVSSCVTAKWPRVSRMRAAMLVTSLLAGTYVYVALLRHGRRRTALRPASPDHAHVTADTPTMIGGDWWSRGHDVVGDFAATTFDGKSQILLR